MRSINYLIINDQAQNVNSTHHTTENLGHHYAINKAGAVLHPIDDSQPGAFMPVPTQGQEDLNRCSIGVKYNGKLSDPRLRPLLVALLLILRDKYPEAKILAKSEYDRHHTHVRDDMNQLRRELSDWP